jgi:mono/diheme cytochrome c family protein
MMGRSRFVLYVGAALVLMGGLTAGAQAPPGQTDEYPKLPAGPGRELTIRVCSQCHSPEDSADEQLDQSGWKSLVDSMASKGADATDEELDEIVQYLAAAFPPPK